MHVLESSFCHPFLEISARVRFHATFHCKTLEFRIVDRKRRPGYEGVVRAEEFEVEVSEFGVTSRSKVAGDCNVRAW